MPNLERYSCEALLCDVGTCESAAHALASGLTNEHEALLYRALQCVPAPEITAGAIYAYRDWSAPPYCDQILAEFDASEILSIFLRLGNPNTNMKLGVLGALDGINHELAAKLATMLDSPHESPDVLAAVRYPLKTA